MLKSSGFSKHHYSELLQSWAHKKPLPKDVILGAGHIHYQPYAQQAHKRLTSKQYGNWTIKDGGLSN